MNGERCAATGPLGELCTRDEHGGQGWHVETFDLTSTVEARLAEVKGSPRALLLSSSSSWVGDWRDRRGA